MRKKSLAIAIIIFMAVASSGWYLANQQQKQNDSINHKIDEISKKLSSWEVAGVSTSVSETAESKPSNSTGLTRAVLGVSDEAVVSNPATPTPSPSVSVLKKLAKARIPLNTTRTSNSTPAPTPTPTPTPALQLVTLEIQNQGTYQVQLQAGDNAYTILTRAAAENNFVLETQDYGSLGIMVTGIGGVNAHENYFWAFYYNSALSIVGASSQLVNEGDTTSWKFETW